MSTPLSYIFNAFFRDTPLDHVHHTQPNSQISKYFAYLAIWLFSWSSGVPLKRALKCKQITKTMKTDEVEIAPVPPMSLQHSAVAMQICFAGASASTNTV